MKTLFKISILLNIGLAGCLIYLAMRNEEQKAPPAASRPPVKEESPAIKTQIVAVPPATQPAAQPAAQPATQPSPAPFRWSQLDAKDYRIYVKNLRAIGCPEPSVRAIVTADVHAVYAIQEQKLTQRLSEWESGSWTNRLTAASRGTELRTELAQLPMAEAKLTADLLGLPTGASVALGGTDSGNSTLLATSGKPVAGTTTQMIFAANKISGRFQTGEPNPVDAPANSSDPSNESTAEPSPVAIPLVFQKVDPAKLGLDPSQLENFSKMQTELQQQFVEKIGGANQSPDDPAYLQRWQQAQAQMDDLLHGWLGVQAWENYQIFGSADSSKWLNP